MLDSGTTLQPEKSEGPPCTNVDYVTSGKVCTAVYAAWKNCKVVPAYRPHSRGVALHVLSHDLA